MMSGLGGSNLGASAVNDGTGILALDPELVIAGTVKKRDVNADASFSIQS